MPGLPGEGDQPVSGHGEDTGPGIASGTPGGVGERLVFHPVLRADDTLTDFHRERADRQRGDFQGCGGLRFMRQAWLWPVSARAVSG
jgi:hypothetical protein